LSTSCAGLCGWQTLFLAKDKADCVSECTNDGDARVLEEAHGFFADSDPAGREFA
jgi:hypothetical protein